MRRYFTALFVLLAAASAAFADDGKKIVGVWKLLAFDLEFQDGSPRRAQYGKNPPGYLILTAEGRMMATIEAEGRKPPNTDEDRANLYRTIIAYSGMYRLEGDKWTTKVDVSWSPIWTGTDQVRYYKLDGDRLEVTSAWGLNTLLPGSPTTRGVLVWERVK